MLDPLLEVTRRGKIQYPQQRYSCTEEDHAHWFVEPTMQYYNYACTVDSGPRIEVQWWWLFMYNRELRGDGYGNFANNNMDNSKLFPIRVV